LAAGWEWNLCYTRKLADFLSSWRTNACKWCKSAQQRLLSRTGVSRVSLELICHPSWRLGGQRIVALSLSLSLSLSISSTSPCNYWFIWTTFSLHYCSTTGPVIWFSKEYAKKKAFFEWLPPCFFSSSETGGCQQIKVAKPTAVNPRRLLQKWKYNK
jgi:hypothetical protein